MRNGLGCLGVLRIGLILIYGNFGKIKEDSLFWKISIIRCVWSALVFVYLRWRLAIKVQVESMWIIDWYRIESHQAGNGILTQFYLPIRIFFPQTVTSKMFKVLDLPHTSILSQRSNKITAKKDKSLQSKEVGSRMIDTLSTGGDTISCSHSLSRLRGSKNTTEYTNVSCPICVEKYKEGDAICWSRNELCVHAYHLECKIGFLMNTDECILCRRSFLQGGCEQ